MRRSILFEPAKHPRPHEYLSAVSAQALTIPVHCYSPDHASCETLSHDYLLKVIQQSSPRERAYVPHDIYGVFQLTAKVMLNES